MAPKPPPLRDPDGQYPVMGCRHCKHPGGQHASDGACRLCRECPGWEISSLSVLWSDRMTDELLAAMAAASITEEGSGDA
jgi:hypothetical protein